MCIRDSYVVEYTITIRYARYATASIVTNTLHNTVKQHGFSGGNAGVSTTTST